MLDAEKAAAGVIESVKGFVARTFETLSERITFAETRVDAVEKSALSPEVVRKAITEDVAEAVKSIPVPKDGEPGKVDEDKIVEAVLALIPIPKDGEPGKNAEVDYDRVNAEIAKQVADLPKPKETPIEIVDALVSGEVAKAIGAIQRPKDGEPGRDALQIDVLPLIESSKSYPRGSFASHKGGLWRAYRNTDAGDDLQACGWQPIVEGFPEIEIAQGDDMRTITVRVVSTTGKTTVSNFTMPVVLDRGVYKSDASYLAGDAATYGGSLWIAQQETAETPGVGAGWRLAVKRGRDGKDGELIQPKATNVIKLK